MSIPADFLLSNYNFYLPQEQIAQMPAARRGESRLMVLRRATGHIHCTNFAEILQFLPEKCLLVANNSKVVPARIFGKRSTGGRVEFLLLSPIPLLQVCDGKKAGWSFALGEGLLRSSKKVAEGEKIEFAPDIFLELKERGEFGRCKVILHWQGDLLGILQKLGELPLPPYIKRGECQAEEGNSSNAAKSSVGADNSGASENLQKLDAVRYQTVYARDDKAGSVAAPTAGLHFSEEMRRAIVESGREWAEVTLYVGYGTFSPVRCEDIRDHAMHEEYVELSQSTAHKIAKAKAEGRAVIAVGTTSARTLEGVALMFARQNADKSKLAEQDSASKQTGNDKKASLVQAYSGWLNVFLHPSKDILVIDGLLTNFHLPESSLLMLVSALAGREKVLEAYKIAVEKKFRFFSYGDAMLIL